MLVKCSECGQSVSNNALRCPHCGIRFKEEQTATGVVAAIIIGLIICAIILWAAGLTV